MISNVDAAIILVYLAATVLVGIWLRPKTNSTNEYFLASRNLKWPVVGAALFASNISTIHLVGLAASGYKEGLVWGNFEWGAVVTLLILAWVFVPFYMRTRLSTLPEFLEKRYSPTCRAFLAFLAILAALFIHIGMSLYAGAAVFKLMFGVDVVTSLLFIAAITGLYTIVGGLRAVVVTETFQTVLLLGGSVLITVLAWQALPSKGIHNLDELRAAVPPLHFTMLQSNNAAGVNWYSVLLGFPILGIWYWCTDQTIVQRVLAAQNVREAQMGALFAGVLKFLPVFFMVFPGLLARALYSGQIGEDSNIVLPFLIQKLAPVGIRGLIAAGLLAALMSTVASALNSVGTLVAVDIAKRLHPDISESRQIRIGKIAAFSVLVLSFFWSTQGGRYGSIFEAINTIGSYLAPPIVVVFLWGVFWRRGTAAGALAALSSGFAIGFLAFLFDLPVIGETKWLTDRAGIPFMMQGWWSFVICTVIHVGVSLATKPDPEAIARVEVGKFDSPPPAVWLVTAVMMILLIAGYWYFE